MVGHWVRPGFFLAIWTGLAAGACGLSGVFEAPGMHQVTLTYGGASTLTAGTTVAAAVTVEADGVPVSNPRLRFVSSDATVVQPKLGDSLFAASIGQATLTISLVDAIFTDSLP